jgi:sec-independent protein translocase protein TatA
MFGLGAGELFLIFIIAKGLGQAMREFQKARDDMMNEMNKPHPENKKDVETTAMKVEVAKNETVENNSDSTKNS